MNDESTTLAATDCTTGPFTQSLAATGNIELVGQKAANLGRMLRAGLQVPPGFVLTNSAFRAFLNQGGLKVRVTRLLSTLDVNKADSARTVSRQIAAEVRTAALPTAVVDALREQYQALQAPSVAVRSSAVGEDSAESSFAGQLDSFLQVSTWESLQEKVRECWASYWSDRSLVYQYTRGLTLRGMGVVVQRFVPGRVSGVLFTRHPDGQCPRQMLVELCAGSAEALVAGAVDPARIVIERDAAGHELLVDPQQVVTDEFEQQLVSELRRCGNELEREFGQPQDIEWAFDARGQLQLLQSRPITTLTGNLAPEPSGSAATDSIPDESDRVWWSNANVNENFPEPISPLLYSIASEGYYHYFRNLGLRVGIPQQRVDELDSALRHIIGVHGGRMYYNLTNIHAALRAAPGGEALSRAFNQFVGADVVTPAAAVPRRTSRIANFLSLARIGSRALWILPRVNRYVARFERRVDEFAASTHPTRLEQHTAQELLEDFQGFLKIRFDHWCDASLADAVAMLSYGLLSRRLARVLPEAECSGTLNALLQGLPNIVSSDVICRLWELAEAIQSDPELHALFTENNPQDVLCALGASHEHTEFRAAFEQYLEDWGGRYPGELLLTAPSYQEQPERVVQILSSFVAVEAATAPEQRFRRQQARRQELTADLRRRVVSQTFWPVAVSRWMVLRRIIRWAQNGIALRERARLKQSLLYNRCRQIVLRIGAHLVDSQLIAERDDVFFLTYNEIDKLLSGTEMYPDRVREIVRVRREGHAQVARLSSPETLALHWGEYWGREASQLVPTDSVAQDSVAQDSVAQDSEQAEQLQGTGACPGTISAPAAVVAHAEHADRVQRGDILVTRQTDPGWGPIFFLISGLVLERGGLLSHGAILAREYGLPTVVGVPQATQRIQHGQQITVDADRGTVDLTDTGAPR